MVLLYFNYNATGAKMVERTEGLILMVHTWKERDEIREGIYHKQHSGKC